MVGMYPTYRYKPVGELSFMPGYCHFSGPDTWPLEDDERIKGIEQRVFKLGHFSLACSTDQHGNAAWIGSVSFYCLPETTLHLPFRKQAATHEAPPPSPPEGLEFRGKL